MIKIIRKILTNVSFIVRPAFWLSSGKVCKKWDAELNALLDHHEQTNGAETLNESNYIMHIKGVEVWIENYPYAYGRQWNSRAFYPNVNSVLPRRTTRIRLRKLVKLHSVTPVKFKEVKAAQDALTVELNKLKSIT